MATARITTRWIIRPDRILAAVGDDGLELDMDGAPLF
jgi:hypothetical protein